MTKEDLEALKVVCNRTTPGPWYVQTNKEADTVLAIKSELDTNELDFRGDICTTDWGAYGPKREDADFIVVAREWMPKLLNIIENFYKRDSDWLPIEDRDVP